MDMGSRKSVYLDKNEGNVDITTLVTSITDNPNLENLRDKILPGLNAASTSRSDQDKFRLEIAGELGEDDIELEFERAVEKFHTHTPYCPNCSHQITKVILRRRKREDSAESPSDSTHQRDNFDLLGCLSCFSIFIPSGNCLNPFRIFGMKGKQQSPQIVQEENVQAAQGPAVADSGNRMNLFRLFGMIGKQQSEQIVKQDQETGTKQGKQDVETKNKENTPGISDGMLSDASDRLPVLSGIRARDTTDESQQPGQYPEITEPYVSPPGGEIAITVPAVDTVIPDAGVSTSLEILKCIVYGGLMELITSLSVVSSAAASDATTLNIICIGLATLVSGLFIFDHQLIDLRNDIPRENSDQQTDRYQELLGRRGHFLLHSSFAILSFLAFGLVPPVVYAFAFHESDDKDYKIIAVAAASFTCILILAAAKAYLKQNRKLSDYIKTVMYYMTMAVSVSGVAYAAGDLVKVLMERLGWFEPATVDAGFSVPDMALHTQAWDSY